MQLRDWFMFLFYISNYGQFIFPVNVMFYNNMHNVSNMSVMTGQKSLEKLHL